ncbi:hypothetical protein BD324DRAFT_606179 [Kockovaella imperatae]|uniref:BTB domain-containing protein n=1 Tax=Kockovaella imperatae TaxID=4999 RepID=A0A1Y1U5X5_9TREE|nr:hypothetical protein BD324DRAFT_606179 [Kockovaella imperatae]ORX33429.1 hypothetical protein BD324DRAFT_606179 [Kockovaella imperatae]
MGNLHVHFYHGNFKAFRQELDGTGGGSGMGGSGANGVGGSGVGSGKGGGAGSIGKSWSGGGGVNGGGQARADPNERDQFGRTVLHLAASSNTQQAYTFLSMLLKNPHISINLQDYESGYTALHRALFVGNLRAARDILTRGDVDLGIKDAEGLTAFDLYNGTVDGTNPDQVDIGTDLYVWGVNRNFALGTGDSSDKAYPDRVKLLTQSQASGHPDPAQRFVNVGVRHAVMGKLHTGVITTEKRGNLSLCGFGTNGRLGKSIHSQISLQPLSDFPHTIVGLALAQDHTLALTKGGYILSWGHNRFAQLGYVIESSDELSIGRAKEEDLVQVSPKRIVGPLKKEWVMGVAAGRMSSACWTSTAVWTWGTNAGHLGYDKAANPVQILPRRVTAISQPVLDVALSDFAMICLLDSYEVVCFHHDVNFRITFSTPRILSDAFPFRPPQSTIKPMIKKVTSCGTMFGALSSIGDVFTFSLPNPAEDVSKDIRDRHVNVKPQLIWALRKSFTAVKDVALGSDGTVIICTHSGHVFVRQRVKIGAGQLKFKRVSYLQRVIGVACNESGAFAAIRVDAKPRPITLKGRTLEEDMALLQPHFRRFEHQMTAEDFDRERKGVKMDDEEEDESNNSITKDLAIATRLCTILRRWRVDDTDSLFSWSEPLLGSDIQLSVGDVAVPAHRLVLSQRVPKLQSLLAGSDSLPGFDFDSDRSIIRVAACHPLVVLLLLQYIYADDVAAVWDARVARALQASFKDLDLQISDIKSDLLSLASTLDLQPLVTVLGSTARVGIPSKTLARDVQSFFSRTSSSPSSYCDVTLVLADKEVHCSSIILRARCPFFEAMFEDRDWTATRFDTEKDNIVIVMDHLKWRPMKLVFKYLHQGLEDDLFDYLHQETLDEFLDFVFEVLAAATELLLDRLVLVCSRVITRHCNVYNAAALACEASFYQADTLKFSVFDYIIASMETMLESGLLDEMHEDVLLELSEVIAQKQARKLSVSRTGELVSEAMKRQKEWLAMQDIPAPRVRIPWKKRVRASPVIAPVDMSKVISPALSPVHGPIEGNTEEIFVMDDEVNTPSTGTKTPKMSSRPMTPLDLSGGLSRTSGPVWRSKAVEAEKVDLRSIMAEAAASKTPGPSKTPSKPSANSVNTTPLSTPSRALGTATSPPSAGAWRSMTPGSSSTPAPTPRMTTPKTGPQTQFGFPSLGQSSTPSRPAAARAESSRVITPIKLQAAPPGVQRKPSGGPAWSVPTTFAPAPTVLPGTSPDSRSFSLLAIQQEEQDFAERSGRPKAVKSFAEIQAEEKVAEEKRREEQEFMKWWEEEQARSTAADPSGGGSGRGRGGRGGGGNRGKGGGRGGGNIGTSQEPGNNDGGRTRRKVPPQRARGGARGGRGGGSGPPGGRAGGPGPI